MTRLILKIIFFFLIAATLLFSCRKDPAIPVNTADYKGTPVDTLQCEDIPPSPSEWGYQYANDTKSAYNAPCFNPLNANEFIYIKGDSYTNISQLIKYNLITKQSAVLTTNIWEHPDWSVKGWIVFNHADNQVWKIKDNGDSITQITTQGGLHAIWNGTGDRIAFENTMNSKVYYFIMNESGIIIDTLFYPNVLYNPAWSPDNDKISTTYGFGYIDMINKQFHPLSSNGSSPSNGMDWTPDSQNLIWCSEIGVFKSNINTNSTIQLRKGCSSRSYLFPSVSPDGSKIIVQRFDVKVVAYNTLGVESNLYMMNIDGSNETKVDIN